MSRAAPAPRRRSPRPALGLALAIVFAGGLSAGGAVFAAAPPPWQRTETREPCDSFNPLRNPYFGDLHVHTTNSIDAILFNTLTTPRQAYRFSTGEAIGLAPFDSEGNPAHTIQLGRPLDFTAVTDHAEGFGAQSVCLQPGLPGYDSTACEVLRQASVSTDPLLVQQVFLSFLVPVVTAVSPSLPEDTCGEAPDYADCTSRQSVYWLENQEAAEEAYDRTAACTFTSFVAYEWSATPGQANLHRNVIFRNAVVPALPVSYVEQQAPQNLWADLKAKCQDSLPGCDWLAIPHNSNISGPKGRMFLPENADGSALTTADAATRATMEPLVEIYQAKGSSECRPGVDSTDEQCGFELMQIDRFQGTRDTTLTYPPLSFVRNALKEGLLEEQRVGANPFRLGFIGSTDTHNGTGGYTREENYIGHSGVNDDTVERGMLKLTGKGRGDESPGGIAAVWAEENSRDALFAAMRRRETYGTSGPRHLLRFFAGNYATSICEEPEFASVGYRQGVPMGAEVGPISGGGSPTFAVLAMKDAGDPGYPSTPLQRIQIVKGWVDGSGAAQEKVFDVAGDPNNGADVDLSTCTPTGTGFDTLCTNWKDPEFEKDQRAFYYARVLENPTCRYSTYICNDYAPDCSQPESVPDTLVLCCDPTTRKTIQERSWSSPIWYRPEGLAGVKADVSYGKTVGTDKLKLKASLGGGVAHDLATQDLRVVISDDDTILDVTVPAGTLQAGKVKNFAGLKQVKFSQKGAGPAKLLLKTNPADFAQADQVDHMVDVAIHIGDTFVVSQSRMWTFNGKNLSTK